MVFSVDYMDDGDDDMMGKAREENISHVCKKKRGKARPISLKRHHILQSHQLDAL